LLAQKLSHAAQQARGGNQAGAFPKDPFPSQEERPMLSRRSLFATLGITLSSLVAVTAAEAATPRKKPLHAKATKPASRVKHAKAKSHTSPKPATLG